MQIKFFDDIFCELEETNTTGRYQCKVCNVLYNLEKNGSTSPSQIPIPCLVKMSQQGNKLDIDLNYKVESILPQNKHPSLLTKVKNFLTALYKHLVSGAKRTSATERQRRYDICAGCEFFDGNACTKCGCPISRQARFVSKLDWSDQHCPIDKW